ncbi:MAG: hypothetical protein GX589_00715 [Deltaproteobacteria bacterium]|nr:hypothetical protein [Deltaproteobacteria bacterium]
MNSRIENILILQRSKSLPANLRETLRLQGYSATTVFDVPAALKAMQELKRALFLVDCGESRQVASQTIKHLVDTPDICDYPCIVITPTPSAFKEAFDRYFMLVKPLDSPCSITLFIETLHEIEGLLPEYCKRLEKIAPHKLMASFPSQSEPQPQETEPALSPALMHPAYTSEKSIPELLFSILQQAQNLNLKGRLYNNDISERELIESGCFPDDQKVREVVRHLCLDMPQGDRKHLYRTAFILGQTTRPLNFAPELREQCAGAAFLFTHAFGPGKTDLLRANYISSINRQIRQEMALTIKESAHNTKALGFSEISALIHKMALLLEHSTPLEDDAQTVAASSLMAADLMDRICYYGGHWNPRASYLLLTKIRSGALKQIHPNVLPYLIKFLVESIGSRKPACLLSKRLRLDPMLRVAAAQARKIRPGRHEKRVEISALEPGMRLTKPLLSFDGSVLLSSDLTLDSDLIWRVWQLASIQIINTHLIVAQVDR